MNRSWYIVYQCIKSNQNPALVDFLLAASDGRGCEGIFNRFLGDLWESVYIVVSFTAGISRRLRAEKVAGLEDS